MQNHRTLRTMARRLNQSFIYDNDRCLGTHQSSSKLFNRAPFPNRWCLIWCPCHVEVFCCLSPEKTSRNDLIMKCLCGSQKTWWREILSTFFFHYTHKLDDSFTCFADRLALTSFKLSISMPTRRERRAADKITPKLNERAKLRKKNVSK